MNMAYQNKIFGHILYTFEEVVNEAKRAFGENILLEDYYRVVYY